MRLSLGTLVLSIIWASGSVLLRNERATRQMGYFAHELYLVYKGCMYEISPPSIAKLSLLVSIT